jgi:glutaminyl-tRNA synthetase
MLVELRCSYIPESRSGSDTSGINVKGVIHWVNVQTAVFLLKFGCMIACLI